MRLTVLASLAIFLGSFRQMAADSALVRGLRSIRLDAGSNTLIDIPKEIDVGARK